MDTVAVLFGGRSAEHDVSIVTAISSVITPLELTKKYRVEAVYIAKDGSWHWSDKLKDIKLFASGAIDNFLAKDKPCEVVLDGGLSLVKKTGLGKRDQQQRIDVVFPAMHGTNGEDGALMGMLNMANVAYVGCDLQASVIAMNKILAKLVAAQAGLKTVPDVVFSKLDFDRDRAAILDRIESKLGHPAFVKPPRLGSSIGVTKVYNRQELENAIEVALIYDDNVLVEMAVPHLREATLPIIGYGEEVIAAQLEEPLFQSDEFFDFDTKYMGQGKAGKGGSKQGGKHGAQGYSRIPADFPKDLYQEAEKVALQGFRAAGCSGIARVDILINEKTNDVYFNEINPLPGSLYAHNWRQSGMPTTELVTRLVDYAKRRYQAEQSITTSFSTNFLQQF